MGNHTRRVEKRLPDILSRFPHLAKNVYTFCGRLPNMEFVAEIILTVLRDNDTLMEYQLFWIGMMLEDYLLKTTKASDLISKIFLHKSATPITKAKILEIADIRFGLQEMRDIHLTNGQSDWLGWASAVGSRDLNIIARNYKLDYFANSSPFNRLIGDIIRKQ